MRRALILNAIDPKIGGVLIRGERGTAKSTAARAMAVLLPEIEVIAGSPFNDNPRQPENWSDWAKDKQAAGEELEVEVRTVPFIDLPVSATEDRVVGSIDIESAIQKGRRQFEPGVLAAANRGLLYIDEVNLLDDHVVDVLLDSAAMGVNIVEREGISFMHPAKFILIGTMNPEEGDLRPQLLDRFALSVDIIGLREARDRVAIMERNLGFEANPAAFVGSWQPEERKLAKQITTAKNLIKEVTYTSRDLIAIASLTASLNVDGHRADLVILKAARAQAAFDGRTKINDLDIALAAELALPHRIKRGPFQQSEVTMEQLSERIQEIQDQMVGEDDGISEQGQGEGDEAEPAQDEKKSRESHL